MTATLPRSLTTYDPLLLTLATADRDAYEAAEGALLRLYGDRMRAVAASIVGPEDVDLVVGLSMWHAATWGKAYHPSLDTVGGWLAVITKRTALDALRRYAGNCERQSLSDSWLRTVRTGQAAPPSKGRRGCLSEEERRGGLTEDQRRAVSLSVVYGYSLDEVCEIEGERRSVIRSRIKHGTERILRYPSQSWGAGSDGTAEAVAAG